MKRPRLAWLSSWPTLTVLGLVAVLAALFGVHTVQAQIEARAARGAEESAQVVVSLVVARNITTPDITGNHTEAEEQQDMDADVAMLRGRGDVLGLNVWSTVNGKLVYTDSAHPTTRGGLTLAEVTQARRGPFTRESSQDGAALDVFIPYTPAGASAATGVSEVRVPRDPIDQTIRLWTMVLYIGATVTVGLTFAAVMAFRRRLRYQRHAARHDTLTGLGNRLQLTEAAGRLLARPEADRALAVLLLDLDGFKDVNDTLGHDAGDRLLVTVAERLRTTCRAADALVRLGGDEFVVLMSGMRAPDDAVDAAQRIRHALRRPIVISGLNVEIDASVGVAMSPQHGDDIGTLLKRADVAMYDAKRTGAGVVVYDLSTDSREAAHLSVLAELRQAIGRGELRLYYQPKSRPDGRIDEVEALVRWQHPTRGLIPPDAFVPLAERTSLIKELTAWVLGEAARQCGQWRAAGQELSIAVNVSARNLLDDDLIGTLIEAARAAGIPVQALRLEITETAVMTDPDRANAVLGQLRAMGVEVSIDDFGVGYTSLSALSTLPIHALKIDRKFVTNMLDSPVDEVLVRNVIQLASDLDLISIAEGVESYDVWRRLSDLGCDEIQGYVLTPPLPPEQFQTWLANWRATAIAAVVTADPV